MKIKCHFHNFNTMRVLCYQIETNAYLCFNERILLFDMLQSCGTIEVQHKCGRVQEQKRWQLSF